MDALQYIRNPLVRSMMIQKINSRLNIPILNERKEAILFGCLYDLILDELPEKIDFKAFQTKRWRNAFVKKLNKIINVPFVSEEREKEWINSILDSLFEDLATRAGDLIPSHWAD